MRQRGEGGWIRIGELLPNYIERLEQRWRCPQSPPTRSMRSNRPADRAHRAPTRRQ